MTAGINDRCPPECRVKLKHIDDRIEKKEEESQRQWDMMDSHYKHWEGEVSKRVKITTLIGLAGVITAVIMTLFGAIYKQQAAASKQLSSMQTQLIRVEEQVKNHVRSTDVIKRQLNEITRDNGK